MSRHCGADRWDRCGSDDMRMYIKATNATADHASESQWAAMYIDGWRDIFRYVAKWYSCPYQYRTFRIALNHYDSRLGVSFTL